MRLSHSTLRQEYPALGALIRSRINTGSPLLQREFGQKSNCTITSLAYLFGPRDYERIRTIAKRFGYNGEKRGTNPFMIRWIMQNVIREQKQPERARAAYMKGVGVTWEKCVALCEGAIPFLLNLHRDGRGYYADHTVTVIGYEAYENGRFLVVYDNWTRGESLIDYDKLSVFCSINWMFG